MWYCKTNAEINLSVNYILCRYIIYSIDVALTICYVDIQFTIKI